MLERLHLVLDSSREQDMEALSACVPEYRPDGTARIDPITDASARVDLEDQASRLRQLIKAQAA
jgi:hypothetical protein